MKPLMVTFFYLVGLLTISSSFAQEGMTLQQIEQKEGHAFVLHLDCRQIEILYWVVIPRYGNITKDGILGSYANSCMSHRIREDAAFIENTLREPSSNDATKATSDKGYVLTLQ